MAINIEKRTRTFNTDEWGEWAITTDVPPYTNTDLIEYRVEGTIELNIADVTNATTVEDGTGIFDKLMQTAILHIEDQLEKNHLTQSESGEVYAATIQTAMQQAIEFVKQQATLEDKVLSSEKQREVMQSQKELYDRQKQAFDDNKYQKLLEAQMNYNGMIFQDADAPDVLNVGLESKVNDVFNRIITTTGSRTDAVVQNEVSEVAEV